ncbi:restriction endonuclease subunit S [Rheinheimera baltica]|uniref:restriction endonuclease subunit S n=1 Tax=Rheinheimera baltica TaxID=67576 RepID=UPI0003FD193A|nr:restriction endonuclease subunit S [Rheinheimera baltica]
MSSGVAEVSPAYLSDVTSTTIPVGYKQTEVGVIPEDWKVTTVGKVVSITTGNKNTQDKVADGLYPFFVRSQHVERINSYSFDGEGVLTAGDGVGTGKIFHHIDGKFDFHQRTYLMYNFGDELDGYYFYIYFSNNFFDRIMSMTAKSSVDSVRREMIAEMLMVMPPKAEQTAIANALSDIDTLISELEKLIAKKQAIKTATMQQLLTGRTRLPQFALRADGLRKGTKPSELGEIPEDWEVDSIGNLISITTGSRNTQDRIEDGTYPFFVRSQTVERINTFSFDGEAVLTAGDGVGTGKIFHYINGKFDFHQRVYLMYNFGEKVDGYFFYIFFSSNFYERIMSMTAKSSVDSVRREMITDMKMLLPIKEEQTCIATILSDMDEEIQTLEQRLSKTRQIKLGMMQELLTGKTRLVHPLNKESQYG